MIFFNDYRNTFLRLFFQVKNKFGSIYFYSALTSLIGALLSFIYVKYAGYEEFGLFVLLMSLIGVMLDIVSSRTSEGVTYFSKLNYDRKNVIFSGCTFDIIIAVVFSFAIGVLLFSYSSFDVLSKVESEAIILYGLYPLTRILFGTSQGILIADEKYNEVIIINFLSTLLRLLATFFVIYVTKLNHTTIALTYAISTIIFVPFFIKTLYLSKFWYFSSRKIVPGFFSYSVKTFLSSLVKSGNKKIDNLIIGFYIGPAFLGLYELCKKLVLPVTFLVNPLSNIYFPIFVTNYAAGNFKKIRSVIKKSSFYILALQISYAVITTLAIIYLPVGIFDDYEFNEILFVYLSVLISFSFIQHTWWCRPFSNSVDPKLSLYVNLLMTLGYLCIVLPLTIFYGKILFLVSIPLLNLFLYLCWYILLNRKLNYDH